MNLGDAGMNLYSIDDLLGNYKDRYFGHGYKKIYHEVTAVEQLDTENWLAHAAVSQCDDWSIKNNVLQTQHVSSIDALVITQEVFNSILSAKNINYDNYILTDFVIKTGSFPIENIDDIKIKLNLTNNNNIFYLVGVIGNMKVKCAFNKNVNGISNTFNIYKNLENKIFDIKFISNDLLECTFLAESDNSSSVYAVSWLIVFAQLGEVMAFNATGLSRDDSNNFWVRKLEFHLNKDMLLKTNKADTLIVKVNKHSFINSEHGLWHSFNMESHDQMGLITVSAKTALQGMGI